METANLSTFTLQNGEAAPKQKQGQQGCEIHTLWTLCLVCLYPTVNYFLILNCPNSLLSHRNHCDVQLDLAVCLATNCTSVDLLSGATEIGCLCAFTGMPHCYNIIVCQFTYK